MVVRRATIEDWQEDAEAAAVAAVSDADSEIARTCMICVVLLWSHASDCCLFFLTLVLVLHVCPYVEQGSSASGAAGSPSGGSTGGSVGVSLGDRVARYGRVLLVTAVVAFKIVEWWNRVEAQVRR